MSHSIPVFILPLEEQVEPGAPTVEWASGQVVQARENVEGSRLRQATSTNWWHCFLTAQLCRHWKIEGLEFLEDELRVLTAIEVDAASKGLGLLIERLKAGPLPLDDRELGPELGVMRGVSLADVLESAVPAFVVDERSGDLHSFVVFLTSLHVAMLEARRAAHQLLYYAPQP